ncbi:hypothetical protein CB0940_11075 [Cercospora beticola]|uniref:Uncharacterized protein n=1 Tax=Cercospora beticola TaxID=122368 RepID=A0A2G5HDC7_CERBT|nr:hypothetical protein CB0940_11075 [Cercospora beticola]PIA90550.1 hypothetical protein CB0940_11075 [Cercospora beticola]CAK1368254.1 unnamed protein product [Cercospora beticola]
MLAITIISTFAALAAAQNLFAGGYGQQPSCTITQTPTSYTCCGPIAAATATSYTNCGGCALETDESSFPLCRCVSPPPIVAFLTSTITACAPTTTSSLTTKYNAKCTKNITKTKPACGDCGHVYATTKTSLTNCGGCALATQTVEDEGAFGICACPTESVTTVTACKRAAPTPYS